MKLTHPDAPGVFVEPKAEHVPAYQSQGWIAADEKPSAEKSKK